MKVALLGVTSDFRTGTGRGVPIYIYELLEHLSKMQGVDVSKEECKNVNGIGESFSLYFGSMFRDFSKYDLVHNLDIRPIQLMRKGKSVLITTVHDCQPVTSPELNADLRHSLAGRMRMDVIQPWGYNRSLKADYLIVQSQLTMDDVVKLGYPKDKISIVHSGIDDRYRAPLGKQSHYGFRVGYIGSFRLRKNVGFAVNAFRKLGVDDAVFEIWGKPRFEYDNLVKLASGDKRIQFKGFAPEDGIVSLYESFDAFVFPTLYEGLCLEILEAQARGVPVIIDANGKVPAETARYCLRAKDEEDMAKMLQDIKDNGFDPKLRKAAMDYARGFTWEKTALDTLDAYRRALKMLRG